MEQAPDPDTGACRSHTVEGRHPQQRGQGMAAPKQVHRGTGEQRQCEPGEEEAQEEQGERGHEPVPLLLQFHDQQFEPVAGDRGQRDDDAAERGEQARR